MTTAATYTVTTTADSGPGSLRDAASKATTNGSDTIVFSIPATDSGCSAPNVCTITLESTIALSTLGFNLMIDGAAQSITIDTAGWQGLNVPNQSTLAVNALTFTNSTGSAIFGGYAALYVTNSTFVNNTGCAGGAIFIGFGSISAINSTFVGNSTGSAPQCNVSNQSGGGALWLGTGNALIVNSTFWGNATSPAHPGAVINPFPSGARKVTVYNSIFSHSTGSNCSAPADFVDGGGNLDDDGTCGFTTSAGENGRNPRLGPLQNNGGPTQTMALERWSPGIDAGVDIVLSAPYNLMYDQRGVGFPRKINDHVDIGADESTYSGRVKVPIHFCPTNLCRLVPISTYELPCLMQPKNCPPVPVACCGVIDPGIFILAQPAVFEAALDAGRVTTSVGVDVKRGRAIAFTPLKTGTTLHNGDLLKLHEGSGLAVSKGRERISTPEDGVQGIGSDVSWFMLITHLPRNKSLQKAALN